MTEGAGVVGFAVGRLLSVMSQPTAAPAAASCASAEHGARFFRHLAGGTRRASDRSAHNCARATIRSRTTERTANSRPSRARERSGPLPWKLRTKEAPEKNGSRGPRCHATGRRLWTDRQATCGTHNPVAKPMRPSTASILRWSRVSQPSGLAGRGGLKARTSPPASTSRRHSRRPAAKLPSQS